MLYYVIVEDTGLTVDADNARDACFRAMHALRVRRADFVDIVLLSTYRGIEYAQCAIGDGAFSATYAQKYELVKKYIQ